MGNITVKAACACVRMEGGHAAIIGRGPNVMQPLSEFCRI